MIIVIDYNVGNVKSVCNAFRHIGCEAELSRDAGAIISAGGLVLPGVAAFGYAVEALGEAAGPVREAALAGKPLLGICVGFQLLFEQSLEHGSHRGLGLVRGRVVPIPPGRTIPHMGWNQVRHGGDIDILAGCRDGGRFYFAHSYYADIGDSEAEIAFTDYGFEMPAAVQKKNIYGTQFHPEKSGPAGLAVLENFADLCK
jgi:glutamine amidotransferase